MIPVKVEFDLQTLFALIGEREAIVQKLTNNINDYEELIKRFKLELDYLGSTRQKLLDLLDKHRAYVGRKCDCHLFDNQVCDVCQGVGGKDNG